MAQILVDTFFPPPGAVNQEAPANQTYDQLPTEALTLMEVQNAIYAASAWKAPGLDGIPAVAWQQLWPATKAAIFSIFEASLRLGRVPRQFKVARIIPLRKADKPDYAKAGAYRPISLLSTLGKALEFVVADRISYLAEKHHLLPNNHFGARKRRSTVQALTVLQERIWDAWRDRKVLSLISFDVKGAYNGVNRQVLLHRLRERRVPEVLARWIDGFCRDRKAAVTVNGHDSTIAELGPAGLPQGSPLSPILFLFFNANLVQNVINAHQGSIAFVDDYTAWVTGPSAEDNRRKIQERFIPKAEEWEESSGASFQPEKTAFIHFSRNARKLSDNPLVIRGSQVGPTESVKILGVVLDQQLRFRLHAARVTKRGLRAVLALKRLRALRPSTTRQLFVSTVAPVVDYASFIWSHQLTTFTARTLGPVQRIAAQAITGAFRTVALPVAQAEASIEPTVGRWKRQGLQTWINLHTLTKKHPVWKSLRRLDRRNKRFVSPLQVHAQRFQTIDVSHMEEIQPYCIPPWHEGASVEISEREEAIERATASWRDTRIAPVFTDASGRNDLLGTAVISPRYSHSRTIGTSHNLSVYFAELFAMYQAVKDIEHEARQYTFLPPNRFVIFSDNQAALNSLAKPRQQSGQFIIALTLEGIRNLKAQGGPSIIFRWVPAHAGVPWNELANSLAREATEKERAPQEPFLPRLRTAARREGNKMTLGDKWNQSEQDRFGRQIDQALPGKHTRRLYDHLSKADAYILAQLRTGKCRLNGYLARINVVESAQCDCGRGPETVGHFLFQCMRWNTMREEMKRISPERYGDLAFWIGGWSDRRGRDGKLVDGEKAKWRPNVTAVRLALTFTKATRRLERV